MAAVDNQGLPGGTVRLAEVQDRFSDFLRRLRPPQGHMDFRDCLDELRGLNAEGGSVGGAQVLAPHG